MSLKKEGASKGAVFSFLVSTPTTGVDSIFATYAMLGGIFTLYRVLASFIAGVFTGLLTNFVFRGDKEKNILSKSPKCKVCSSEDHSHNSHGFIDNLKGIFKYAFGDLLRDSGPWLIIVFSLEV